MKKYPFTQKEFFDLYSQVPRLNVELLLVVDKKIALVKRTIEPYLGMWHIPGGTVFKGENLEEAAKRVASDELGAEFEIGRLVGVIEYPEHKQYGGFDQPVGLAYLVKRVAGEIKGSDEGEEIEFFGELPENLINDQKIFLEMNKELIGI